MEEHRARQLGNKQLSAEVSRLSSVLMFVTVKPNGFTLKDGHRDLIISCLSSVSCDINVARVPSEILFAECLCEGCLINQREDHNYNSVPVFSTLRVLMKTPCQDDPNKYVVTEHVIKVPVACTCVVPVYVS